MTTPYTPPCIKCGHDPHSRSALVVAIFPPWMVGHECSDEAACMARRVVAGHRLPLPGIAPREGLT
jgi:hypothetical protein